MLRLLRFFLLLSMCMRILYCYVNITALFIFSVGMRYPEVFAEFRKVNVFKFNNELIKVLHAYSRKT